MYNNLMCRIQHRNNFTNCTPRCSFSRVSFGIKLLGVLSSRKVGKWGRNGYLTLYLYNIIPTVTERFNNDFPKP